MDSRWASISGRPLEVQVLAAASLTVGCIAGIALITKRITLHHQLVNADSHAEIMQVSIS